MSNVSRKLTALTGGLLALGGLTAGMATPASAAPSDAFPTHVFAPYVDTGMGNTTLTSVASSYGTKYFTLAFVDGAGCQWSMPNTAGWQSQIADLRAAGGDVAISFGGWTSDDGGTDLGNTCSSPEAAAAQMESVVTTFGASRLDFDIESIALTNSADVDRTNKALAEVQTWAGDNGRQLSLAYTLGTAPTGLPQDAMNVLDNGKSNGFTPDVVNVMTMDYGRSGTEMGDAANQALDAVAGQVAGEYGKSISDAYAMLGDTPMIGQNDSPGEVFTTADAASVESYAASKGIALLSDWSEGRDNGDCAGQTTASSSCSGITQDPGAFTTAFQRFAD
jgi:chitinase